MKEVQRLFLGSCFKEVSREFKESVKCVSRKVQTKCQVTFKNVSMKFCFAIFIVAWISSQLSEQNEALFSIYFDLWIKEKMVGNYGVKYFYSFFLASMNHDSIVSVLFFLLLLALLVFLVLPHSAPSWILS